jgi:uncharacterized protein
MFVDTGAWYAGYIESDPNHLAVRPLIDAASTRLITTDYVLAETLNLLRARNELERAVILGRDILEGVAVQLIYVEPADIHKAFVIFSTYWDKSWSFTDCTSLVVMQRLKLSSAIALDHHFQQMPGIHVYP